MVQNLNNSVVSISSREDEAESAADEEKKASPFFIPMPNRPARSLGSGIVLNEQGYIATNNHVVGKARTVLVQIPGRKGDIEAEVIGRDEKTDLALIKIDPSPELQHAYLGNSDSLEVGQWVIAIGNQFQLGQSVTAGIVSATSRRVPSRQSGPYDQFIQTDASINPGSSGGPLINTAGQVIGINTAIFSPGRTQFGGTGFNIGIGFAIPINVAKRVLTELRTKGKVSRGVLGVLIQEVTSEMAEIFKLDTPHGALVADVIKPSPASRAGFVRGDVILGFDQQKVREHSELPYLVSETPIGKKVKVEVLRDGRRVTLNAEIGDLGRQEFPSTAPIIQPELKPNKIGLVLQSVDERVAKAYKLREPVGAFVLDVEKDSIAQTAGIRPGDVVEEIGRKAVRSVFELEKRLDALKKGVPVLMLLRRKDGTRYITLKLK